MNIKTIYRLPDSVPPGSHAAAVKSLQIEPAVSKAGNPYERLKVDLGVFYEEYDMIIPMYFNIPIFWRKDATLVKVAKAFNIFPKIGEAFHVESLAGMAVRITIEESTYNDKVYNNIVDMVPLNEAVPQLLKDWLDQQVESKQMADTLFEDENEEGDEDSQGPVPPPIQKSHLRDVYQSHLGPIH